MVEGMQLSPSLRDGAAPHAVSTATSAEKGTATTRFVPEIQGLRTIALLLVATFHIWIGRCRAASTSSCSSRPTC